MTDVPVDDEEIRSLRATFIDIVSLKASNQSKRQCELEAWRLSHASLSEEDRSIIDQSFTKAHVEITAQFGKSKKYRSKK